MNGLVQDSSGVEQSCMRALLPLVQRSEVRRVSWGKAQSGSGEVNLHGHGWQMRLKTEREQLLPHCPPKKRFRRNKRNEESFQVADDNRD